MGKYIEEMAVQMQRIPLPADQGAQNLLTSAKSFASAIAGAALGGGNPDQSKRTLEDMRTTISLLASRIQSNPEAARVFKEHNILRILQVMHTIALGVQEGKPEPGEDEINRLLHAVPDLLPPSKKWWQFWK